MLFPRVVPSIILACLLTLPTTGLASSRIRVYVSILPQKYFVERIGGDLVDVRAMVHPGASPATYEPKPRQMAALTTTRLYFSIGVPFENTWLKRFERANPDMRVIHTDHGIKKIPMESHHHQNGKKEPHVSSGQRERTTRQAVKRHDANLFDPHIWLSPALVRIQAKVILEALRRVDPIHRKVYQRNFEAFISKIAELDSSLRKLFANRHGATFIVFHPSWGYFARAYGLVQLAVEIEGKSPKPARLKELIQRARSGDIRVVFAQPQFSIKSATLVAKAINGKVIFVDPLAENWLSNIHQVAQHLSEALR